MTNPVPNGSNIFFEMTLPESDNTNATILMNDQSTKYYVPSYLWKFLCLYSNQMSFVSYTVYSRYERCSEMIVC